MNRPLLIPIIFFLAGILTAGILDSSVFPGFTLAFILALSLWILFAVLSIKREKLFFISICLFFFLLGIFRYTAAITPAENDISNFVTEIPQKTVIYGAVTGTPEWKGFSYARRLVFPLRAERILRNVIPAPLSVIPAQAGIHKPEQHTTGTVLVNLFNPGQRPRIGDKLVLIGKISLPGGKKNPAGFDHKTHLNRMGIRAVFYSSNKGCYLKTGVEKGPLLSVRRSISKARDRSDSIIRRYLHGTARAVTGSAVLGLRGGITDRINDIFVKTGTMHILAVSGLHVGIVAAVIMGSLWLVRCPGRLKYFLTIIGICAFAVFTGSRPSSMRAAIMGSFVLFSLSLGRKTDILNSLALSAFLITFFRPGQLTSPGFILSYFAVLSIIYITPVTDPLFGIKPPKFDENRTTAIKRYFLKSLSLSLAIWLGMIPVVASYFRIITPSVILTNLLAVPALFVIVILGFILLMTGSLTFLAPAAFFISGALDLVISLFMNIMRFSSELPFSYVRVPSPNIIMIAIYYAALAILIFYSLSSRASGASSLSSRASGASRGISLDSRTNKTKLNAILIFLLFAANIFIWNEILITPPKSLRATFFDVGKADASTLEFPDGSVMIIDGGSGGKGTGFDAGRNVLAPYLRQRGIRRIDCVLLTHDHEDHIGGLLYILRNFKVGTVIDGGDVAVEELDKSLYKEFRKVVKDKNIFRIKVKRSDIVKGFPGVDLTVFNPPRRSYGDANEDSIVAGVLTDRGSSILFCADAQSEAMKDMLRFGNLLETDLMKAPHHGAGLGDMSVVGEFIGQAAPVAAVITNKNKEALNKALLEDLSEEGTKVYVTGISGAVIAEQTDEGFEIHCNF
ncbi:MAG: ComEC/Rec2 family competence protein [Candidatus Omnitrophota bacterium]|nr:ComEC/Rec2 family competence protein [Candidatus Omnitrophota bacterium]